jgi:hypothetical protein
MPCCSCRGVARAAATTRGLPAALAAAAAGVAAIPRAILPLLKDVDDTIGEKLEDVLLDVDEVDELFADAEQLAKIVSRNAHILEL